MNKYILNIEIQDFINKNITLDITTILLKGTSFKTVGTKIIIEQLEAKKRCEKKLPTWFNTDQIYYPNKLNIEQTSSEITAAYKSHLIEGENIIDLTGGFGVDCYYFSKRFKNVVHCEIEEELSNIVKHNYKQLNINNIETINTDGIEYLSNTKVLFDWVYVDPSRRHEGKGKVFFLNDCLPNIPTHLDVLFKHAKNVMIKTSPLLDLSVGIGELKCVKSIHIIAVNNEVKELLWILENGFKHNICVEAVNIKKETTDSFSFLLEYENRLESQYNKPLTYLYEPNAAILKSGGFSTVSKKLNVYKLHKHSHLYTSEFLIDFPGRSFKIERTIPYNKKAFKRESITKANITTRNFPETVKVIRKKLNIEEGGHAYLFFTTDIDNKKIIIISSKLNAFKQKSLTKN